MATAIGLPTALPETGNRSPEGTLHRFGPKGQSAITRASYMLSAHHGAGHRHLAWFYAAAWPDIAPPLATFRGQKDHAVLGFSKREMVVCSFAARSPQGRTTLGSLRDLASPPPARERRARPGSPKWPRGNKHKQGHEAVFRHVVSCVRMRKTLSFIIGSAAIAEQAIGPPMGSHSALVTHSHQEIPVPKMCSNRTLYGQICGAMRQRLTANQASSRNVSLLPAELTFS
jgi:hypothetical protein